MNCICYPLIYISAITLTAMESGYIWFTDNLEISYLVLLVGDEPQC